MNDTIFGHPFNDFSRQDGIILILFFTVFIYYLISMMKNKTDGSEDIPIKYNVPKSILFIIIGLVRSNIRKQFCGR